MIISGFAIAGFILTASADSSRDPWEMEIENTSVPVGTTNHVFYINGVWAEDIIYYDLWIRYDDDVLDLVSVNANGCVGENGDIFYEHGHNYFRFQSTMFNDPVPAGEGRLAKITVNIIGDPGVTAIDFTEIAYHNYYFNTIYIKRVPTLYNGSITITNEAPSEPIIQGPTEGNLGEELSFTISATDPEQQDLSYMVDWDDGTSDEYGPFDSGEEFQASHIWNEADEFTITVTVTDEYDAENSNTHDIEIIGFPEFSIEINGGTGINTVIKNIGTSEATHVDYEITIEGGFFVYPRSDSSTIPSLAANESYDISKTVFGFGLGYLTPIPVITISVDCSEGSSAVQNATAKIFFTTVTIA